MLSTGLGNWLQGINFGKVTSNSNLAVHRIQLDVVPRPELNLTFDWHGLTAPELNNLGGNPALSQLTSSDIGNEVTLTARWAISRNWYFQGVASYAKRPCAISARTMRGPHCKPASTGRSEHPPEKGKT